MDLAYHETRIRFDIRAEREECERLLKHPARVLQDRLARRGESDRTRRPSLPEWKKILSKQSEERRLLHQARVLSWGKEKRYYYIHRRPISLTRVELSRNPQDDSANEKFAKERDSLPNAIVESRTRIKSIVSRMKEAIANHDFVKARLYSDEERIERAKLRFLYQENGPSGS